MKFLFSFITQQVIGAPAVLAACILVISGSLDASAAPGDPFVVRDQFAPGTNGRPSGAFPNLERAQTFPVTVDGLLDSLELWINESISTTPAADTFWDIRPTVGGIPVASDSLILASGVIPEVEVPNFRGSPPTLLHLIPFDIYVNAGDILAVTLRTQERHVEWATHSLENPGEKFDRSGPGLAWVPATTFPARAHAFATYIRVVPEPASALMISIGSVLAIATARWRTRRLR